MKNKDLKIVTRTLEELKPYEHNAKEHPPEQVNKIAESIVAYGYCDPIIISKDNDIIAGHGRYLALKQLQRKEAPCVLMEDLTPEQVRGLRIAHNKVAESGTNLEHLKMEFQGLNLEEIFTGYSPVEVQLIVDPPVLKTDDSKGTGEPVISFTIVFDDQQQQDDWFGFIRHLKANDEEGTVAAKIMRFLQEHADF